MAKLIFAAVLLVALVGLARTQNDGASQQPPAGNYGSNMLGQALNPITNQQGGLLSGLLGNANSNSNNNSGGPLDAIRQLPARGMQMLSNVVNGVRNMLPGLGRTSSPSNQLLNTDQLTQNLPAPLNGIARNLLGGQGSANGQQANNNNNNNNNNGLRLPNLDELTRPVTDSLQQGKLPDLNQLSRGATNTVNGLTDQLKSLPDSLSGQNGASLLPNLNGGNQQGLLGGLGGMLNNLAQPAQAQQYQQQSTN